MGNGKCNINFATSRYQYEVTKYDFIFSNWKFLRLSRSIDLYFGTGSTLDGQSGKFS